MSRVQLALNVDDVDEAVAFYSRLFQAQPAKRRPGYANFALEEPALKLVLIENPGHAGTLNHLGVEVGSTEEVAAATQRLAGEGLVTEVEEGTTCCYARSDKFWAEDPQGLRWESFHSFGEATTYTSAPEAPSSGPSASSCCAPAPVACADSSGMSA